MMAKRAIFVVLVASFLNCTMWGQEYIISTVAGPGGPNTQGFSGDGGPATSAQLNDPQDVVVDQAGNIFIADTFNNRIRKVSGNGTITTIAGGGSGGLGDGGPAINARIPN